VYGENQGRDPILLVNRVFAGEVDVRPFDGRLGLRAVRDSNRSTWFHRGERGFRDEVSPVFMPWADCIGGAMVCSQSDGEKGIVLRGTDSGHRQ